METKEKTILTIPHYAKERVLRDPIRGDSKVATCPYCGEVAIKKYENPSGCRHLAGYSEGFFVFQETPQPSPSEWWEGLDVPEATPEKVELRIVRKVGQYHYMPDLDLRKPAPARRGEGWYEVEYFVHPEQLALLNLPRLSMEEALAAGLEEIGRPDLCQQVWAELEAGEDGFADPQALEKINALLRLGRAKLGVFIRPIVEDGEPPADWTKIKEKVPSSPRWHRKE